jgi:hypothetical protein
MAIRELPARPNLEHLKNQARTLLRQGLASDASAIARFAAFGITTTTPKLADALHIIAREYGFDTWPALKLHIEVASEELVEALTAAIKANNPSLVRDVLAHHPSLKFRINEPLPNYSFDTPPLIAAVQKENREIIDVLLNAGANVNQRTRWWAGSFGVLDCASSGLADYLISRGAVSISMRPRGLGKSTVSANSWRLIRNLCMYAAVTASYHSSSLPPLRSPPCCLTTGPTSTLATSTMNLPPRSTWLALGSTWNGESPIGTTLRASSSPAAPRPTS